jgi:eukaryotic translation initiation factor 2C
MNYIQNWTNSSSIDKDPVLKEYNISINLKLIEMEGRVLEAPDVQYGGTPTPSVTTSKVIAEKGSWDHRNCKFVNSIPIKKWVVLNFSHRIKDSVAYEFASALIRIGKGHGMNIAEPLDYGEIKGHRAQINEDVRRLFENMVTKYQGLEMIVAIFGGQTTIYNTIKTCGDIGYGITTQGVEDKNVSRIKDQTISNILLKINTKLGGRNWFLSRQNRFFSSHLQELYQGPLMIFGADVTHPSPGDLKVTESIAAVVGSLDKECSFYAARLFAQKSPKGQSFEMIHSLNEMFLSLLNEFYRINKTYPKRLVFFRDGVSEGQFSMVLRWEMNKIREACQSINTAYKPAVTFVLVQKRHHTRLFPVDPKDKNGTAENVPPGTIVDKQIVSKSLFDFFLCSHVGIQVFFILKFKLIIFLICLK